MDATTTQAPRRSATLRRAAAIVLATGAAAVIAAWVRAGAGVRADARSARAAIAAGRYAEAEPPLGRWLKARPGAAEPHYLKARVALALDRPQEAVDELRAARDLGHPEGPIESLQAQLLARAGRHEEAEPILRRLRAEDSGPDPELDRALAQVYLETFRFGAAAEAIDRWIRDAPRDATPYLWRIEIDRRIEGGAVAMIRDYREALRRDPGLDRARLGLAETLAQRGRHAEAEAEFAVYLARRPDDPAGHLGAGRSALELGEVDAATQHIDRALALNPEDVRALIERSGIDIRRGEAAAALARLDRAARIDPYDPDVRHRRAQVLALLGRPAEAKAERERAARLKEDNERMNRIREGLLRSPGDRRLRREAAHWLIEHGHGEEGARWAREILRDDPADPAMNRLLAGYYQGLGNAGLANFYRAAAKDDAGHPAPP
jgi:predicted Zn-dependent protease